MKVTINGRVEQVIDLPRYTDYGTKVEIKNLDPRALDEHPLSEVSVPGLLENVKDPELREAAMAAILRIAQVAEDAALGINPESGFEMWDEVTRDIAALKDAVGQALFRAYSEKGSE